MLNERRIKSVFSFSDTSEKLTEENKKLHVQFLEQKQQLEELNERLKFYSRVRVQPRETVVSGHVKSRPSLGSLKTSLNWSCFFYSRASTTQPSSLRRCCSSR